MPLSTRLTDQVTTSKFNNTILDQELSARLHINLDAVGNQQGGRQEGLYSISRSKLANLSKAEVLEFHHNGFLAALVTRTASLFQFVRLQQLHNAHASNDGQIVTLQDVSVGLPD